MKNVKTSKQRIFFRCAALKILEIRQDSCEFLPCPAKNLSLLGIPPFIKQALEKGGARLAGKTFPNPRASPFAVLLRLGLVRFQLRQGGAEDQKERDCRRHDGNEVADRLRQEYGEYLVLKKLRQEEDQGNE